MKKDLFDVIGEDVFDRIGDGTDIFDRITVPIIVEIPLKELPVKETKKSILGNLPPQPKPEKPQITVEQILAMIHVEIARIPKPEPQKIVEKVIEKQVIKEVAKKDDTKRIDPQDLENLKKKLATLEKELSETKDLADRPIIIPGGPGVIGIPVPEGNNGKVLTVVENKAVWGESSSDSTTVSLGDSETDGSWRITVDGNNLSFQRRESGAWVEKSAATA